MAQLKKKSNWYWWYEYLEDLVCMLKHFIFYSIYYFIMLSEPFKMFDFDFRKRPNILRETGLHVKAINDSFLRGL